MVQLDGGLGFAPYMGADFAVQDGLRQHFDCNVAIQQGIMGAVHHPHLTPGQFSLQAVALLHVIRRPGRRSFWVHRWGQVSALLDGLVELHCLLIRGHGQFLLQHPLALAVLAQGSSVLPRPGI